MSIGKRLRVVYVEDNPLDAVLVQEHVSAQGFDVEWVLVDTLEGLEEALGGPPVGLVLSDYTLPSFDGLRALQTVRGRLPDVPFVFVSGTIGEERAVEALRQGATDYVLKDRLARLGPAIQRALKDAALRAQRKLVEEELHRTFHELHRLLDVSPTIIYSARPEGGISFVSDNIHSRLGYDPRQLTRSAGLWTELIHAEDRPQLLRARERPEGSATLRYRVRHADGGWRWIEDRSTVARDAAGAPIEVLGSWTDVTENQRMAEEHTRLEEQFHQAQKLESIGSLVSGVAHDFNNILMVILGYCDFLLIKLPADAAFRREVQEIQKAANRAAGLVQQLLAFSRKQSIAPRPIRPDEAIRSLHKMIERLIGENIELTTELDVRPGHVMCDPTHFDQILVNLIVNARDAMPDGGKLTVGCRSDAEGEVTLWVSDTGVGIPPEILGKIYDPFFTTKPAGKGTGLGLAMVWGAVKQNGGRIDVKSEPGVGTTFRIDFPFHRDESAPSTPAPSAAGVVGTKLRVLLVEDNESVRAVSAALLRSLGHAVVLAESAEQAIEVAEREGESIGLVVTDVVMQGMSGPSLAKLLRRGRPGLPVLFCTGYPDEIERVTREIGSEAPVLPKPFDRDGMARSIQGALRLGGAS